MDILKTVVSHKLITLDDLQLLKARVLFYNQEADPRAVSQIFNPMAEKAFLAKFEKEKLPRS